MSRLVLAVDIGGTKLAAAVVSPQGRLLLRAQEPTDQSGPEALISQIARMLRGLIAASSFPDQAWLGAGIGIPAVLEPGTDFVIWGPNLQGWRNVDLAGALRGMLGLPVYVEYDGHTAVLGEWWQGAGRGYRSLAMIIVGTGIGGGLILDGQLYRGRDRLAGAAGWFALTSDPEASDPRGQSIGHWESQAAGPGIARRAASLLADYPGSSLHAVSVASLDARVIFQAASQGDELAGRVVAETGRLIGLGVANVISLVNPEVVVLGGSIGCRAELLPFVREVVGRWAQPASARSASILSSQLGADAGLYGAAYTAWLRGQPAHPDAERS